MIKEEEIATMVETNVARAYKDGYTTGVLHGREQVFTEMRVDQSIRSTAKDARKSIENAFKTAKPSTEDTAR